MSRSYLNITVVATSDEPIGLEQAEDVTPLFDESSSVVLVCNTINWLPAFLTKLTAACQAPGLEYLGSESSEVTVLDPIQAGAAARAIETLLEHDSADPGSFMRLSEHECTENEVLEALRAPARLPEPQHDLDNDWGYEEPLTAIGFLKGHVEVLKIARNSGRHAIHAHA